MRYISKGSEPHELINWKRINKTSPENLCYGSLGQAQKDAIKEGLLKEQGYLCAYTMHRICSADDCHIEHINPQSIMPEQDIDYANLVACFPKDGGDVSHGYGAPVKASRTVEGFVSPLRMDCEQRLTFAENGSISSQQHDQAARDTIALLKLDHPKLVEYRSAAIVAHGITLRGRGRRRSELLTAAQARALAKEIMRPDHQGYIAPFCTAIAQVALRYAQQEESRAQRMKSNRNR